MPATAVGSAKGRSINALEQPSPGEAIADQHPGNEQAEHAVHCSAASAAAPNDSR